MIRSWRRRRRAATRDGLRHLRAQYSSLPGDQGSPGLLVVLPDYARCVFSGGKIRPRRESADPSTTDHVRQKHLRYRRAVIPADLRSRPRAPSSPTQDVLVEVGLPQVGAEHLVLDVSGRDARSISALRTACMNGIGPHR